ncbi:MAG: hypothetical protein U9Q34_04610, partial [Elusimicrobiota bacterium]|nr:hypothetical protein [Elusimicrobiota bacterium]
MRFKALTIFLILAIIPSVYSAEADQYSVPANKIVDITYELNNHANNLVEKTLEELNMEGECRISKGLFNSNKTSEEKLYEALKKIFFI